MNLKELQPDCETMRQIKHALGLDGEVKPRYGKLYGRNHFETYEDDSVWDKLFKEGYAIRYISPRKPGEENVRRLASFHLSVKALDELEVILGIKIVDYENVLRWGEICGNCYYHGDKCVNSDSRFYSRKTNPTTHCRKHKFKMGLAYGGFVNAEHYSGNIQRGFELCI
jgi:hypothetical protein